MSAPTLRERLLAAMHEPLHALGVRIPALTEHPGDHCNLVAEVALDALLPVLADSIKPHRWDKDYPDSAPPGPCRGSAPDTFYAGVLHAAAVVCDLLEPVIRDESKTSTGVCSCGKPFPEDGGAEGVCECCSGCAGGAS